ncbi:hypothetical protein vseg_011285 [Gypsophila vaccaria]
MEFRFEVSENKRDINNKKMADTNEKMTILKYGEIDNNHDCYVVDLENVVHDETTSVFDTTINNSTSKLQRSLSRKITQRGMEGKISDKDALVHSSSPKGTQAINTLEKLVSPLTLQMDTQDNQVNNHQPHHQITIKTATTNTMPKKEWRRRPSFKRSPSSWLYDPKRILLLFATLSIMGTMLLILFTLLSMSKHNEKDGVVLG